MYPKNAWYVACTPGEIADQPLGRMVCGEKIVFFRPAPGQVAALQDFCPHRGAPLSLGRICEGALSCGYHGLQVGADGLALSMPGQRVQGFARTRSFPVNERHGFVWVWPGAAELADPAAIAPLHWADDPEWAFGGGLYHIACDYRLMIDNLMDLTHETYVHAGSIGQKEIDEAPSKTRIEGGEVITSRFMSGVQAPPFWQMALRMHALPDDQPVDRWQVCHFRPPGQVLIEVGVALAGQGGQQAAADKKVSGIVVDFITPETGNSIHYFWGLARNFQAHDGALTAQIREGQGRIFAEDRQMLELQQQNLLRHPERRLMTLNIDAGGVQSRRLLERALAAEQAQQPA